MSGVYDIDSLLVKIRCSKMSTTYSRCLMQVNTGYEEFSINGLVGAAVKAEVLGYDSFSTNETSHNPYLPLVLAAEHTKKIGLRTSIALSFARSPMDTAYLSWDLQNLSKGRFVLGLGSQVRGHIVRRFSLPWAPPAPRMREYISALKEIWSCWQNGTKLNFAGDHYSFNLMPPFFNPGPIEFPDIKIFIAGVNPNMLKVAGELCDGVLLHSFNTPLYTREVILPNIKKGAQKTGRSLDDIDISGGGFIVTGRNEEDLDEAIKDTKNRIAFYASTRSYGEIMRVHGWEDVHENLYRMSVDGKWAEMGSLITDDMLSHFAVTGTYEEIAGKIKSTYGPYASSISFSMDVKSDEDEIALKGIVAEIRKK